MISHQKRFIFIHPQKTGGNTVSHLLLPYCENFTPSFNNSGIEGSFGIRYNYRNSMKHKGLAFWLKHLDSSLGQLRQKGWRIICTIRNPKERVLSWYDYEVRRRTKVVPDEMTVRSMWNFMEQWYGPYSYENMCCVDGECGVTDWVHTENMNQELPALLESLEIPVPRVIEALNVNEQRRHFELPGLLGYYMVRRFGWDFYLGGWRT